jgi:hypothetical protein
MPSTTIIAQPGQLMPAYNPIKYIINNTNKNEPGFRYIFTIYPAAGSHIPANVVAQYKVLPTYYTGYGEQDISLLMQSLVTFNLTQGPVPESWYQYDVDLGYEYIYNVDYTSTLQDNGGNVRIVLTGTPNLFVAGDQVVIAQTGTGPTGNPALEGLHTVISATASTFTVNVLWSTIGESTANGNVAYADQRKIVVLNDALITNKEVFNGAYSSGIYANNEAFPVSSYDGLGGTQIALSSLTNNSQSSAALTSSLYSEYFLLMCRVYSGVPYNITFYDNGGNILAGPFTINTSDGLYNFNLSPSQHGITEDYHVEIEGDGLGVPFWTYWFKYDDRCAINQDTLVYLDRMGSWQTFTFQLKTYEKGQITREQYNQHINGFVASSQWQSGNSETGFRTYNTNVAYSLDLNTNWMDQYNADRFQELLTSPQVYYGKEDGFPLYACTVESTGFENFRQRNKNLIKQSVTIKLAKQVPING